MALMLDLGMSAGPLTSAIESTLWGFGTAWLRWLKNCTATSTADVLENSFETASTGTFVAQRSAGMVATLQWSATNLQADVLRLILLSIGWSIQGSMFSFKGLALACLLLARTTTFTTFMSTAIECRPTDSRTLGRLINSLMADRVRCCPTTAARYLNRLKTWSTSTTVTLLLAKVAAAKQLLALLLAVRYWG